MADASASYWVHDLDPFALQFTDSFGIRWYGLAYLVGILMGWWLAKRWSRKGLLPISEEQVGDLAVYIGICMIAGGRLGYMLLYYGQDTATSPPWAFLSAPWTFFNFLEGGMASHGGILGFFVAVWLFCRKHKVRFWVIADLIAAVSPIGVVFGRIANYINGELWGRVGQVPWAVHFPASAEHALSAEQQERLTALRPQFPEIFHTLSIEQFSRVVQPGTPAYDAVFRILTEPRHPSQLYAAFLEGIMILAIAIPIHIRHQRPALTAGVVLMLYAVGRIIGEMWREPDRGAGLYFDLISKGQMFSIPFFAFGLFLVVKAKRAQPCQQDYIQPVATEPSATKP